MTYAAAVAHGFPTAQRRPADDFGPPEHRPATQFDDIDRAIAEFKAAIGDLFQSPGRRQIELLKSRIAVGKRAHRGTATLERDLCALMTKQLKLEAAA